MSKFKKKNMAEIRRKNESRSFPGSSDGKETLRREPIYNRLINGTPEEIQLAAKEFKESLNNIEKRKDNLRQQVKVNQELLKVSKRSVLLEMLVPLCIVAALATHYMKPHRQIERAVSASMVGAGMTYAIGGYVLRKKESKLNNQLKILKKQEQSLG